MPQDKPERPDVAVAKCRLLLCRIAGKLSAAGEANLAAEVVEVEHRLKGLPTYRGLHWFTRQAEVDVLEELLARLPNSNDGNLYCSDFILDIVEKLLEEAREKGFKKCEKKPQFTVSSRVFPVPTYAPPAEKKRD